MIMKGEDGKGNIRIHDKTGYFGKKKKKANSTSLNT